MGTTTKLLEKTDGSGDCPVRILLDQLADRWAVLVLLAIGCGPVRFNALKREVDGVTPKVLAQTLTRMERNGLVRREVIASKSIAVHMISPLSESLLLWCNICAGGLSRKGRVSKGSPGV